MAEYIERKDLLELYRMDDPILNKNGHVPLPVIRQNIIDIPAADVAQVRHGLWEARAIPRSDPDGDWIALEYHCSLCNRLEYRKENYCPNCGAKMDLEG